jgi:hypothetical protein
MLELWAICRKSRKTGQPCGFILRGVLFLLRPTDVLFAWCSDCCWTTVLGTIQLTIASRVLVHNLIVAHLFSFQFSIPQNLSTYSNGPFRWLIASQINPILSYLTLNIILPGRDNSVRIATSYVLDGPGIQSRWGRDFSNRSGPVFGPTQPPVKWALGPFPKVKATGKWH